MSFYSYKNANVDCCPGTLSAAETSMAGVNERACVQVKRVFDSCMQQEQIDDVTIRVTCVEPVREDCGCNNDRNCPCPTDPDCNGVIPPPFEPWNFVSARAAVTEANIRNLSIDRLCERPQFARVRGNVDIPLEILFTDARCNEWIGHAVITVTKDVLLCIPDDSIVPFCLENMVSAVGVSGTYKGGNEFEIDICVTIILKVLAKVELLIPTYGYCPIPPCEEYAENVCDEFFSLPLYPQPCGTASGAVSGTTPPLCNTCNTGSCNTGCKPLIPRCR